MNESGGGGSPDGRESADDHVGTQRAASGPPPERIDADDAELFAAELEQLAPVLPERIETDADDIDAGVARLVLTLVELVRQVLEHQAVRRMEGGSLSEEEIERLGLALMRLEERLDEIRDAFGVDANELNIDLGPLGRLL